MCHLPSKSPSKRKHHSPLLLTPIACANHVLMVRTIAAVFAADLSPLALEFALASYLQPYFLD
jgi:hypothetical protein